LKKADGTEVAGTLSISTDQTEVTLDPTANLDNDTDYIAVATKDVEDLAGNNLATESWTNFTTVAL
jgi:hypothetical protein